MKTAETITFTPSEDQVQRMTTTVHNDLFERGHAYSAAAPKTGLVSRLERALDERRRAKRLAEPGLREAYNEAMLRALRERVVNGYNSDDDPDNRWVDSALQRAEEEADRLTEEKFGPLSGT